MKALLNWICPLLLFSLVMLTSIALCAADPVRFIPATPENTALADGSPISTKDSGWRWVAQQGKHGFFETAGDTMKIAQTLLTRVKKHEPGKSYEVFTYFCADDAEIEGTASQKQSPVQLGLTLCLPKIPSTSSLQSRAKRTSTSYSPVTVAGLVLWQQLGNIHRHPKQIAFRIPSASCTGPQQPHRDRDFPQPWRRGVPPSGKPFQNIPLRNWWPIP